MNTKKFYVLCIGLFALALAAYALANFSGYCISDKKFLSDKDRILLALDYSNQTSRVMLLESGQSVSYQNVPYASADEILKKFPNCCQIHDNYSEIDNAPRYKKTFFSTIFGLEGGWVSMKYPVLYKDSDGQIHAIEKTRRVHLENCGKPDSDPD